MKGRILNYTDFDVVLDSRDAEQNIFRVFIFLDGEFYEAHEFRGYDEARRFVLETNAMLKARPLDLLQALADQLEMNTAYGIPDDKYFSKEFFELLAKNADTELLQAQLFEYENAEAKEVIKMELKRRGLL